MTTELAAGQVIDGMKLVSQIGEGGLGAVWRAEYLGAPVAVKFLKGAGARHHFAMEAVGQYRLSKEPALEARSFAKIEHYQPEGEAPYLRMELIEGEDLGRALTRGALPFDRAMALMESLLAAMAFAHDRGFVHGDLKPANLILAAAGDPPIRIIDCGFGYAIDRETPPAELALSGGKSLRSMSMGVSTSIYAAPERFTRRFIDDPDVARSCDVYSLGRIFYQMLSGEEPANVFPLEGRGAGVTRAIDRFLAGCVQNRCEVRWANAREALAAFLAARRAPHALDSPAPAFHPGTAPIPATPVSSLCPKCNAGMPASSRYCSACGYERPTPPPVAVLCPQCRWEGAGGVRYCGRCGTLLTFGGGIKGLVWTFVLLSLSAAIWSFVSECVDLSENPHYISSYHDPWTSHDSYPYSEPDYVAAAFGGVLVWLLASVASWALFRWRLRRPATPLLWSCLLTMTTAVLAAISLGESRSSSDHEGFSASTLGLGGLVSIGGFVWILVERAAWRRRWAR